MSIADHFDQSPDAGFIRNYDRTTARRQFHVSLMLIVVIALAATALGFLVRFETPSAQVSSAMVSAPAYAGKL